MEKQSKEKKVKENKKGKNKKKHIFLKIVLILLLIILILAGIFIYKWQKNGGGWKGAVKATLGYDETKKPDKIYCLLLGQSQNLTDTIMLASYDPGAQEAALLSIPRDTFIGDSKANATAWDKINAVYQTGPENTLKEVKELTGINVKYYLKVDTKALRTLVDEIGGVYFDVPIDMKYDAYSQDLHINLKAGYQLLDGDKAEQVLRFRHNNDGSTYPSEYGGEDLGRMKTQRAFLTTVLEQTIKNMDINTIFSFMDIAEQYVETNLDFDVIKEYVPWIIDFNIENLKTDTLPGLPEYANGVAIYAADEEKLEEVINKLFYSTSKEELDGNTVNSNTVSNSDIKNNEEIKVEVLNGSGSSSKLNNVVDELETLGFEVTQTGNTSTTNNTTIIDRNDVSQSKLEKIKETLGSDNVDSGDSSSNIDVTIIIGTDYIM